LPLKESSERKINECGLYAIIAIANSTSLTYGKDPINMTYIESAMQEYLFSPLLIRKEA